MGKYFVKYGRKVYIKIPFGEIQYGINTRRIILWYRGKAYHIKGPNYKRAEKLWLKKRY